MLVTVALLVLAGALCLLAGCVKPRHFPPGPVWWPVLGSARAVAAAVRAHGSQHAAFAALARRHRTRVLGLKLGGELVVVLLDAALVPRALLAPEWLGRPRGYFMRLRCLGRRGGITGADGALWREHRQFAVRQLRRAGLGGRRADADIACELSHICAELRRAAGAPVPPRALLAPAVMNVLWKLTAGEELRRDARLDSLLALLAARSRAFDMCGGWLNQFPWLRFLAPAASGYDLVCRLNAQLEAIISDAIARHERGESGGADFMSAFLERARAGRRTYTRHQLACVCLDFLIAGSQTTSHTLEFAFLMALRHPAAQRDVQRELDACARGGDAPGWEQRARLPRTLAFLLESQRLHPITPLLGPRRALAAAALGAHRVPRDTTLLLSLHALHHDARAWPEPARFVPGRFLRADGALQREAELLTFGLGRRRCPGDALARRFAFAVFAGVLLGFRVEGAAPPGKQESGILTAPPPYSARFVPREAGARGDEG